jgi:hypothetical protein
MMHTMRTTVTLDPDTDALVRRLMRERSISFKEAVNAAIRAGATQPARRRVVRTPTFAMGEPRLDLNKALGLAAQMEDDEIIRKLARRS